MCRKGPFVVVLLLLTGVVVAAGCKREKPPAPPAAGPIRLTDVTSQTGITFVHTDGSSGRRYIVEPMSAGLALFDYDNDGLIDIYFLNGAPLPGTQVKESPRNRLYHNDGGWHFSDVTEQSGAGDTGFGLGVTAADFDNDGFTDLFVNNCGPNALYHNNGDGSFTDVTRQAGVTGGDLVGAGTCFFDMDGDGDLDLYVANYLKFDPAEHVQRSVNGIPTYPSPHDYEPVPDALYENNGDGSFTDVSLQSGVATVAGTGMGMVCADGDRDGDTDVFVLNDVAENFYFRNDGNGHFEEVAMLVGLAYNGYGQENASMGVDCGDVDNDGLDDFFMTSYQGELPVFYHNLGDGRFEDATEKTRAGLQVFPYVNWGIGLIDFDSDGDRDIFIANGHTEDNIELYDTSTAYRVKNVILLNDGKGHFRDVTETSGTGLVPVCASRGTGFDDLDNDGDVDGVVQNSRQKPTLMRNDCQNGNHWVQLRLHGTRGNRDAIGATLQVKAGAATQVAEVHSGRGYQSHYGLRLHFGLGKATRVDHVEIHWHGGKVERFENVPVDRLSHLVQGAGT